MIARAHTQEREFKLNYIILMFSDDDKILYSVYKTAQALNTGIEIKATKEFGGYLPGFMSMNIIKDIAINLYNNGADEVICQTAVSYHQLNFDVADFRIPFTDKISQVVDRTSYGRD